MVQFCCFCRYSCITIDESQITSDPKEFEEILIRSLDAWVQKKLRGAWLKLVVPLSHLIPIAMKHGFALHHAKDVSILNYSLNIIQMIFLKKINLFLLLLLLGLYSIENMACER